MRYLTRASTPGHAKAPQVRRPTGLSTVREGGVEPPRPFGHWNLNPARLPIPPPAHWVCLRAVDLVVRRLPTRRTLARGPGCVHIPSSGAGVTARCPRQPPYVSAATGSRINLVPMAAVSPVRGPAPQPGAGHWSSAASTILGRRTSGRTGGGTSGSTSASAYRMHVPRTRIGCTYRMRVEKPVRNRVGRTSSTPVGGVDRGNQPIHRRVDTISKQYQVGSTG